MVGNIEIPWVNPDTTSKFFGVILVPDTPHPVDPPAIPTFTLRGGAVIPLLGLGTWEMSGDEGYSAIREALAQGYRHLDTATIYKNESLVGRAIKHSGIDRDELFITTKVPGNRPNDVRETLETSLTALEVDYLDLWLMHWAPDNDQAPVMWEAMIKAQSQGLVKSIGVSNFDNELLDQIVEKTAVTPAINQIPWSPNQFDAQKLADHARRGIVVQGYSPFKGADLEASALQEIAATHNATPHQVIIRWHLDRGVVVIPKSVSRERLAQNLAAVELQLTDAELAKIDELSDEETK